MKKTIASNLNIGDTIKMTDGDTAIVVSKSTKFTIARRASTNRLVSLSNDLTFEVTKSAKKEEQNVV